MLCWREGRALAEIRDVDHCISDQVIKQPTPYYNDELDGEYDRVDVKVLILRFAGIYRDSSHIKITRGICLIFTVEKYFNFILKIFFLTLVCLRLETPTALCTDGEISPVDQIQVGTDTQLTNPDDFVMTRVSN